MDYKPEWASGQCLSVQYRPDVTAPPLILGPWSHRSSPSPSSSPCVKSALELKGMPLEWAQDQGGDLSECGNQGAADCQDAADQELGTLPPSSRQQNPCLPACFSPSAALPTLTFPASPVTTSIQFRRQTLAPVGRRSSYGRRRGRRGTAPCCQEEN